MSLTTLSVENRITARMNELQQTGLTAAAACKLIGISTTKWSQALSGIAPFENKEGAAALALLDELVELVKAHLPVPVSLRNPSLIAPLLEQRRRFKRDIPEPMIFSVGINEGRHYFVEKNSVGDLIFTLATAMAATMPRAVADRVAETLTALGYQGVSVIPNPFKGLNGLLTTFQSLMRLPKTEDDQPIAITTEFEPQ